MSAVIKGDKAKRMVLLIAALLIVAAIVLQFGIGESNERESILDMLASYGYRVSDDDLYIAGDYKNTSISELLPEAELQNAINASKQAGFPSDVQSRGDITLILIALQDNRVITLYFLNGETDLCFVQKPNSQDVEPLGGTMK